MRFMNHVMSEVTRQVNANEGIEEPSVPRWEDFANSCLQTYKGEAKHWNEMFYRFKICFVMQDGRQRVCLSPAHSEKIFNEIMYEVENTLLGSPDYSSAWASTKLFNQLLAMKEVSDAK